MGLLKVLAAIFYTIAGLYVFLGWFLNAVDTPTLLLMAGVLIGGPIMLSLLLGAQAFGLWLALWGLGRVLRSAGWWRRRY